MRNLRYLMAPSTLLLGGWLVGLCGCGSDTTGPILSSAPQNVGALRFNQHAITLAITAPYNTIQLSARPFTVFGVPLSDAGAVRYYVLNRDTSIAVDSVTGLVRAKAVSYQPYGNRYFQAATILATLTARGVTLTDTAVCIVTATAPDTMLDSFSIHPPPDSVAIYQSGQWLTAGTSAQVSPRSTDHTGDVIPNPLWYGYMSDSTIAAPTAGGSFNMDDQAMFILGLRAGKSVMIYAQTWYYGVARSDSFRITVGLGHLGHLESLRRTVLGSIAPQSYWWPERIELSAPARISFTNQSYVLTNDVVFDDPTDVLIDSTSINGLYQFMKFYFPISQPGNVPAFLHDTSGLGAACGAAQFDGTTNSADSTCRWKAFDNARYRLINKPGTYRYHNLFGASGSIVVH